MGVLKKLKKAGGAALGAAEYTAEATYVGAKASIPTKQTFVGAAHGNVGDIAQLGLTAAAIYGGVRGASSLRGLGAVESEAPLTARLARSPIKFPSPNPEAAASSGIKNRVATALNEQFGETAREFRRSPMGTTAPAGRQAELTSKIKAIRTELAQRRPSNFEEMSVRRAGDPPVNPGEKGAFRIPGRKRIEQAHANVPEGEMLTTVTPETTRATKGSPGTPDVEGATTHRRAVEAVKSGRAKVAGFYEKLKSEKGWVRAADKPTGRLPGSGLLAPAHTEIRFGEGKFPGESALGEGPLKKGFYRATLQPSKKPGAVKVGWLEKKGEPGNVARPLDAVVKGLKARGVTAIEHQPISDSRSRLFARQLRKMGLKNLENPEFRHIGAISKRKPAQQTLATGWGR